MRYIKLFGILAAGLLGFSACDYVSNATETTSGGGGGGNNPSIIYRKVLVEDYTGHKCGNCPAAALVLKHIDTTYHGKVVPLAVHAGFFANINGTYPTDLRSTAGTDYDNTFGISIAGNPNGLVNRKGFGSSSFIKLHTLWESEVISMDTMKAKFSLRITNNYNSTLGVLNTSVTVKSLENQSGNYNLIVLLSEDSIIAEQLDYSLPSGSQLVANYEFNHVLRGAVNSSWGENVFNGTINFNDSIVKSYNNFAINPLYKPAKLHVVAFIYDADSASPTYYEVFQAEQKEML